MFTRKKHSLYKITSAILLMTFVFLIPGSVFAFDDVTNGNVEEVILYEENGNLYECILEKGENCCEGIIYEIVGEDKIFCDDFIITTNGYNEIYKNGELIATFTVDDSNTEFCPMELYPEYFTTGKIDFSKNVDNIAVATSIFLAISQANPYISVGAAVFTPIATEIVKSKMSTGWYQVRSQMETFPQNVPTEFFGAIYKTDYRYTIYKSTEMISANRIGNPIYDVYYAMP